MIPNYQYPFQGYPQYQPQQPIQQPMQNIQPSLMSKVVDDFSLITANDVPMDGSPALFLKRDLSQIQLRKWGSDGRIYTSSYNPFQDEAPKQEEVKQISFDAFEDRLKGIEEKIDKLLKPATVKKGAADGN